MLIKGGVSELRSRLRGEGQNPINRHVHNRSNRKNEGQGDTCRHSQGQKGLLSPHSCINESAFGTRRASFGASLAPSAVKRHFSRKSHANTSSPEPRHVSDRTHQRSNIDHDQHDNGPDQHHDHDHRIHSLTSDHPIVAPPPPRHSDTLSKPFAHACETSHVASSHAPSTSSLISGLNSDDHPLSRTFPTLSLDQLCSESNVLGAGPDRETVCKAPFYAKDAAQHDHLMAQRQKHHTLYYGSDISSLSSSTDSLVDSLSTVSCPSSLLSTSPSDLYPSLHQLHHPSLSSPSTSSSSSSSLRSGEVEQVEGTLHNNSNQTTTPSPTRSTSFSFSSLPPQERESLYQIDLLRRLSFLYEDDLEEPLEGPDEIDSCFEQATFDTSNHFEGALHLKPGAGPRDLSDLDRLKAAAQQMLEEMKARRQNKVLAFTEEEEEEHHRARQRTMTVMRPTVVKRKPAPEVPEELVDQYEQLRIKDTESDLTRSHAVSPKKNDLHAMEVGSPMIQEESSRFQVVPNQLKEVEKKKRLSRKFFGGLRLIGSGTNKSQINRSPKPATATIKMAEISSPTSFVHLSSGYASCTDLTALSSPLPLDEVSPAAAMDVDGIGGFGGFGMGLPSSFAQLNFARVGHVVHPGQVPFKKRSDSSKTIRRMDSAPLLSSSSSSSPPSQSFPRSEVEALTPPWSPFRERMMRKQVGGAGGAGGGGGEEGGSPSTPLPPPPRRPKRSSKRPATIDLTALKKQPSRMLEAESILSLRSVRTPNEDLSDSQVIVRSLERDRNRRDGSVEDREGKEVGVGMMVRWKEEEEQDVRTAVPIGYRGERSQAEEVTEDDHQVSDFHSSPSSCSSFFSSSSSVDQGFKEGGKRVSRSYESEETTIFSSTTLNEENKVDSLDFPSFSSTDSRSKNCRTPSLSYGSSSSASNRDESDDEGEEEEVEEEDYQSLTDSFPRLHSRQGSGSQVWTREEDLPFFQELAPFHGDSTKVPSSKIVQGTPSLGLVVDRQGTHHRSVSHSRNRHPVLLGVRSTDLL
ncbi:hypothetical protein IE53DRAFT_367295 [Violaceomyces palustris]|uniref:Uncharacterized protein n=1 Tax=Violaceomyces palustris TaxID=1673888 RepID=A0ACD0P2K5_9BASI|nr:hypothetical protein IE53DRAFT_367295 [Violaceomyces palustris]